MKTYNINEMKNGWFIGDFYPSVFKNSSFEVAHHSHKAGHKAQPHTHKISQELTYIVSGKLLVSDIVLSRGDMFLYEPYDIADVTVLEDVDLIVIKWPSIPSDKYIISK